MEELFAWLNIPFQSKYFTQLCSSCRRDNLRTWAAPPAAEWLMDYTQKPGVEEE